MSAMYVGGGGGGKKGEERRGERSRGGRKGSNSRGSLHCSPGFRDLVECPCLVYEVWQVMMMW